MTTSDDGVNTLEQARADVAAGHEAVARGDYREAMRRFAAAWGPLREHLGPAHPEVEELRQDGQTVQDMAGVADFHEAGGLRMPGDLPDLPGSRSTTTS